MRVTQEALEAIQFGDYIIVDESALIEPKLIVHALHDHITVGIKGYQWGKRLYVKELERPATWFQMLKEAHAPQWVLRKWPVRKIRYTACALWPGIRQSIKGHGARLLISDIPQPLKEGVVPEPVDLEVAK